MKKLFVLLSFLLFTLALFSAGSFAWWNTSWSFRAPISINGSISVLTDYPVQVVLNWTSGMNATFTDLRFTDNSTNGVSLPFWIENYTASTNATVWVKANLSVGNNTIYVYYNNPVALSASNASTVFIWNKSITMGYTFDSLDGSTIQDYSANAFTLTIGNAGEVSIQNATAKFGSAITLNPKNASSYAQTSVSAPNLTGDFTACAWTYPIANTFNNDRAIFSKWGFGVTEYINDFDMNQRRPATQSKIGFDFKAGGGTVYGVLSNSAMPLNAWTYNCIQVSGTTMRSWFNGSIGSTTGTISGNRTTGGSYSFRVGAYSGSPPLAPDGYFNGSIDELRIYPSALTGAEINQSRDNYGYLSPYSQNFGSEFLRLYSSPEPVVLSTGAEEGQDSIPPSIQIQSPANSTYTTTNISLNFTTSETLSVCKYELNGVNTTFGCINTTFTAIENNNSIKLWANDSANNWNVSATVYFSVDSILPSVAIQSPQNKTYNTATIDLNFTLSETASSCLYELDGVNTSITGCQNLTISPYTYSYYETPTTASVGGSWQPGRPGENVYNGNWGDEAYACTSAPCEGYAYTTYSGFSNNILAAKYEIAHYGYLRHNITVNPTCVGTTSLSFTITSHLSSGTDRWIRVSDCASSFESIHQGWGGIFNEEGLWASMTTEGSHSIKVWANDTSNNWNVSQTISFTIDTTYPIINLTYPTNNLVLSSNNITLNFTLSSDSYDTCKYELNNINTTIGGCVNTTFIAAEGANTVKIWANDTANNWNVSQTISFTVDTVAPAVTIQSPTAVTYASVSVPLNFTVGDAIGVSQCKYELNGAANVSLPNCANITLTAAVGNNTVKVWANDTANNWGVSNSVAFKVDTVFPVWTIGSFPKSDNSTVVNGSIAWDARVSDANLYRILLNVTSAANGSSVYSLYESDWNLTEYNFTGTTDTSGWAEGKYVAEFSATDDHTFGGLRGLNYTVDGYKMFFGNGKTNYSFAFQTRNPNGTIMPLAMSADLSTNVLYNSTRMEYKWGYALKLPNPSFRATVFLNSSTDRIVLRNASIAHFVIGDFYVDFSDVLKAGYLLNVSNGSGGYFIDIWKESYGVSPNSVIIIDPVSGGTNTQTEFYSFNVDHTVPTIVLNSPANNSWTNNNTPIFNVTTTDNIATSGSCNLTVDNVRMAAGTWTNNTPFTMSNTTALAAGAHYWNVSCADSAGLVKTSQTFAVSIDTVNPNVVCVSCPVFSSTSSLTFSVTATDALSGVNVSRLFYRGAYYTMSKSGDTYSYSLTENNNGEYSYQFFVNDTAGNLNSTVTGSVVVGASTSSPPPAGGGGGGGDALTVADLLGKLQNLTQPKPFIPSENVSYISRPAADVTNVNLSAWVFDYSKLGEPYYILPSSSPIQQYVSNFPKWSVLVPISAITGLISTAAFGGGWGGAAWVIATYFEGYWIADLNTWVNVNGTLVALNATVGG